MSRHAFSAFSAVVVLGALGQACTLASPTYITTHESQAQADAGAGASSTTLSSGAAPAGGAASTCAGSDFVKPDLTKLTACGNGLGHCYDKTKVPMSDQLTACPNAAEVCVPNEVLQAGGGKLQSCTSIIGPGGCVQPKLIPALEAQGAGVLKPDVCTGGQLCVPCNDPTHGNAPTPFCSPIGVHDAACSGGASPAPSGGSTPPAPQQACCTTGGVSNGVCIAESAVPASSRDQVTQDSCSAGNACVPKSMVSNNPQVCNTSAGARGVCMDMCFNSMLSIAGGPGVFSRDWCGPTEVCLPCSFVAGKGVPGCQ